MESVRRWKADWGFPTSLLCIYGFFSTVKPLEPFLIPYLTGPDKNLTVEQVTNQILPVWTYSYLAVLVPVFLVTDWLHYKPVVVFQCCALFITTAMLLWLQGVAAMQAMQFMYGVVTACEVAYFSYIYTAVELRRYRRATSYCRTAQLLGYTTGSVLGQLLVSFGLLSYHHTLVLTLTLTAVALATSCFLPMPRRSMFFHRGRGVEGEGEGEGEEQVEAWKSLAGEAPGAGVEVEGSHPREAPETGSHPGEAPETGSHPGEAPETGSHPGEAPETGSPPSGAAGVPGDDGGAAGASGGCGGVLLHLWRDFLQCYSSSRSLLYWSVWWALATCGYNQTINYVQVLWEQVEPSRNFTVYNGGVEAVSNLFGAATAYGIGFSQADWSLWGELALGSFSGLGGCALLIMALTRNIWVCYAGYVIFKCLYMLLITIAMFQIAAELSMERYALIFGVNNFGALVLQTIITSIVVDSRGLGLDVVTQFIIYGSYFSAIALLFLLRGLYTWLRVRRGHAEHTPAEEPHTCPGHRF